MPCRASFDNLALFQDILDHVNITNENSILVHAHIKFQYKLAKLRNTVYCFPFDWCIGEAIPKLTTDLVFILYIKQLLILHCKNTRINTSTVMHKGNLLLLCK